MVLTLPQRLVASLATLYLGCLGTQPAQKVTEDTPIAVALRLSNFSGEPLAFPAAVREGIARELSSRGFTPTFIDITRTSSISIFDTSTDRFASLDSQTSWLLVVDASARFFSQLTGRFRWDVTFDLNLTRRENAGRVDTKTVAVPAFLQYEHEREPEALGFVERQLETELGALLDRAIVRTIAPR